MGDTLQDIDELSGEIATRKPLLGQGAGMASLGPLNRLSEGVALSFDTVERVGPDLRVIARVGEHHNFLHLD